MCELFAMSSRKPTAVTYSLNEFSRNGSKLRYNRDGWGIAFARDREALLVKNLVASSRLEFTGYGAHRIKGVSGE